MRSSIALRARSGDPLSARAIATSRAAQTRKQTGPGRTCASARSAALTASVGSPRAAATNAVTVWRLMLRHPVPSGALACPSSSSASARSPCWASRAARCSWASRATNPRPRRSDSRWLRSNHSIASPTSPMSRYTRAVINCPNASRPCGSWRSSSRMVECGSAIAASARPAGRSTSRAASSPTCWNRAAVFASRRRRIARLAASSPRPSAVSPRTLYQATPATPGCPFGASGPSQPSASPTISSNLPAQNSAWARKRRASHSWRASSVSRYPATASRKGSRARSCSPAPHLSSPSSIRIVGNRWTSGGSCESHRVKQLR